MPYFQNSNAEWAIALEFILVQLQTRVFTALYTVGYTTASAYANVVT
jgi:hypothetical protein